VGSVDTRGEHSPRIDDMTNNHESNYEPSVVGPPVDQKALTAIYGQRAYKLRLEAGWNQGEVALRLRGAGVRSSSQATVSRLEGGLRAMLLPEALAYCRIFDVNMSALTGRRDPPTFPELVVARASLQALTNRVDLILQPQMDAARAQIQELAQGIGEREASLLASDEAWMELSVLDMTPRQQMERGMS
jgi:transcriptional regulator with XRE-family HTH domain